ncbi:ATP-binding cassette domain-containing protein [Shewanella gelidii]|uniref:ABC transporter ATP-binding protein n=1 Tax=Shewanella gelidii TaxID=1642821 RepID=A0A917JNF3_9GAMM|nr:ATP-binding cassette domain-containing protein [Shewanella gelidii]MCL1097447.1 ATP-binding cassette domain-containing protein [Shewanella gelidii]GGI75270.1 ABC transporter ATP-binding protein [Shewanella gelidii]
MTAPLLRVTDLHKRYFEGYRWFKRQYKQALKPVSFCLNEGETLAIVGEAGSGKSTLARILVGAASRTGGSICFEGESLANKDVKQRCKMIRMIFQDPNTSLNPRLTIGELLEEPLRFTTGMSSKERKTLVSETLVKVGLLPEHFEFYPHMISEGQKQRVAVARAIILNPKVIIADEALTALDLSVRSQILNLLVQLQKEMGLSYIFVSHNLNVIRHVSDNIIVLHKGVIVEQAATETLFNDPQHEYTKRLIREQSMFTHKR